MSAPRRLYVVVDDTGHTCSEPLTHIYAVRRCDRLDGDGPHHIEPVDVRPLIETGESHHRSLSTGDTTQPGSPIPAGSTTSTPTKDTK